MNFIAKLWRGEYSLAKSYWLFSVVVSAVLGAPISVIEQLPSASLANIWIYGLIYIALYAAYMFIAAVGVWRAATGYTNGAVWKYLAKIHSALTILSIAGVLIYFGQQVITQSLGSSTPTYSLFNCGNIAAKTEEDCNRTPNGIVKFDVNKDKSEVIIVFTDPKTNQQGMMKLEKCVVLDKLNWQCGGDPKVNIDNKGNGTIDQPYAYSSNDGNVSVSDATTSLMMSGKIVSSSSVKAGLLKQN